MAKRITFDIEIIEIPYTSLRQITIDSLKEFEGMTYSARMSDVDYLVKDNTRDDFGYHRKWMGPMASPLLKIILNSSD